MHKSNLAFILIIFLVSSCGYSLQGSETRLPPSIKSVFIEEVKNKSTNTSIGIQLRDDIINRFEKFAALEVMDSKSKSDVSLKTTILAINSRTSGVTGETDIELESDISMEVSSKLIDNKTGVILWENSKLRTSKSYANINSTVVTTSSNFAQSAIDSSALSSLSTRELSRGQEEQALNELSEETAKKIYGSAVVAPF